jgi:hypothetical protein
MSPHFIFGFRVVSEDRASVIHGVTYLSEVSSQRALRKVSLFRRGINIRFTLWNC